MPVQINDELANMRGEPEVARAALPSDPNTSGPGEGGTENMRANLVKHLPPERATPSMSGKDVGGMSFKAEIKRA